MLHIDENSGSNPQADSFYGTKSPAAVLAEENIKKGFSTHSQFFGRSANNFNKNISNNNISNHNNYITGTSSQINLIDNANKTKTKL